ncbi:MAG: efflux RND transporter periplasmic adaptor subunit [Planctomycetota bacterium]
MKTWQRRTGLAVGGLSLLAVIAYAFGPRSVPVDIGEVLNGTLIVTVDDDGMTRVRDLYRVSAPVSGTLRRIALEAGDPVKAGRTLLATIDPHEPGLLDARARAEAEARVSSAESRVEQATAARQSLEEKVELARSERKRIDGMYRDKIASARERERAERDLAALEEELRAAVAAIKIASFELELARAGLARSQPGDGGGDRPADRRLEIVSPIDGRVFRVLRESGGVVNIGEALLDLGDPSRLEIVADYLSVDAVRVKPGARVMIEGWGGKKILNGRVRMVEPSGFTKISALGVEEQRVNVIADFTDPPETRPALGDGFRVELRIVVQERANVLKVPVAGLFHHGKGWEVYRVIEDRARRRRVRIGMRTGLEAEVTGGLEEGDRVILYPGDDVEDGTWVVSRQRD